MFLPSSRYANLPQCLLALPGGTAAAAVKLRRLPAVAGTPVAMNQNDRLDNLAGQQYSDGTMFWHIADANAELYAPRLLQPWLPGDPQASQITILVPGT